MPHSSLFKTCCLQIYQDKIFTCFVLKCPVDFISYLKTEFCERRLAGLEVQNTVKGPSSLVALYNLVHVRHEGACSRGQDEKTIRWFDRRQTGRKAWRVFVQLVWRLVSHKTHILHSTSSEYFLLLNEMLNIHFLFWSLLPTLDKTYSEKAVSVRNEIDSCSQLALICLKHTEMAGCLLSRGVYYFLNTFSVQLSHGKSGHFFQGKLAAADWHYRTYNAYWIFECLHDPLNSAMDYGIFNVR